MFFNITDCIVTTIVFVILSGAMFTLQAVPLGIALGVCAVIMLAIALIKYLNISK